MDEYDVEPNDGDVLIENIKKYNESIYSLFKENINQLSRLIEKYGIWLCVKDESIDIDSFRLSDDEYKEMIRLSIWLNLILAASPTKYESEYHYMKKHWKPDWEICACCDRRNSSKCDPSKCNPMDI